MKQIDIIRFFLILATIGSAIISFIPAPLTSLIRQGLFIVFFILLLLSFGDTSGRDYIDF